MHTDRNRQTDRGHSPVCSAVTPWLSGQRGPPWKAETAEARVLVPLCVTSGPVWVQRSAFRKLALFKEFLRLAVDGASSWGRRWVSRGCRASRRRE